jgi:hypothetical protein
LYCGGHGASCKLLAKGTCYRCCLVPVSTTIVALSGTEAVVVDVAVTEVLALRVHALAGDGFLLLITALVGLLFLVQSVAA